METKAEPLWPSTERLQYLNWSKNLTHRTSVSVHVLPPPIVCLCLWLLVYFYMSVLYACPGRLRPSVVELVDTSSVNNSDHTVVCVCFRCLCICLFVWFCVSAYGCVYVCTYLFVCFYVFAGAYLWACACFVLCVSLFLNNRLCIRACMCVHLYMFICMAVYLLVLFTAVSNNFHVIASVALASSDSNVHGARQSVIRKGEWLLLDGVWRLRSRIDMTP